MNSKSILNELSSKNKITLNYLTTVSGPGFTCVLLMGEKRYADGKTYNSKQAAEEAMATLALQDFQQPELTSVRTLLIKFASENVFSDVKTKFANFVQLLVDVGKIDESLALGATAGFLNAMAESWNQMMHATKGNTVVVDANPMDWIRENLSTQPQGEQAWLDLLEYVASRMDDSVVLGMGANALEQWLIQHFSSIPPGYIWLANTAAHNRIMHALNGNIKAKQNTEWKPKSQSKTAVQQVAKKEAKKEVKKEVKKELSKEPRRSVPNAVIRKPQMRKVWKLGGRVLEKVEADAIQSVLTASAAPGIARPFRYASEYTTQATAVAKPFAKPDSNWILTTNTFTQQIASNLMFGAVFRDPMRSAIYYDSNPAGALATYELFFEGTTIANSTYNFNMGEEGAVFLPIAYGKSIGTWSPHGAYLPVGVTTDSKSGAVYLENTTLVQFDLTVTTGALVDIYLERYNYPGWIPVLQLLGQSTGTGLYFPNVTLAGYYRVKVTGNPSSTVQADTITFANFKVSSQCGTFCHIMAPNIESKFASVNGCRVNAASIMYSNTASALNASGEVAIAQIPGTMNWQDYALGSFNQLAQQTTSAQLAAKTGVYGFLKPSSEKDFKLKNPVLTKAVVNVTKLSFPLDDETPFIATLLNVASDAGKLGYWTFAFGLEFVTIDQWFDQGQTRMTKEIFVMALERLKEVPQFHENPLHMSDIWNAVKKIASGVMKYGPMVMEVAAMLA